LTSGQQSIISIDRWDDPTITKLYLVAMEMVKNDKEAETDKVETLQTICQATQSQFEKILSTVFDDPSRAQRYAEAGRLN
jgi:thiazole synthase ThiGH ThiG subunit